MWQQTDPPAEMLVVMKSALATTCEQGQGYFLVIAAFYLPSSEHRLMSSNAFRGCSNCRSLITRGFRTRSALLSRRAG